MLLVNVLFHMALYVQRDYAAYGFALIRVHIHLAVKSSWVYLIFFAVLICNTDLIALNDGNLSLPAHS